MQLCDGANDAEDESLTDGVSVSDELGVSLKVVVLLLDSELDSDWLARGESADREILQ